ncbi:MAG: malto-oligosyltrehalose trehalohydrolase [Rhodanobacteraceae bacterium]
MSEGFACALPFGAELNADGGTADSAGDGRARFRVWAPSATSAAVVFDDTRNETMTAEAGGWFCAELACACDAAYRYRFDDGAPVPDPASRGQRGGVFGSSLIVDPHAYRWRHPEWCGRPWHEAVIYELHVGACGGYAGVLEQLPRLRDLGVTAIELMPIAEFPGSRNWGYDGVLPFAPSAAYGSVDELKALIDSAHGQGLMVLLDVVYNHFGPLGNYLAEYAAPFFRDDIATPWGRAIDFRRPEVREFFIMNARYWIEEYRFDGLRLDAVHAIQPNDWLIELASRVRGSAGVGRHVHLVVENDANSVSLLEHGFDAQWNDDFHHALHVLLTGEREGYYVDYAEAPAAALARCLAEGFVYQGEYSAHRRAPRGDASASLPMSAFIAFLQNHDQVGNRALGERLSLLTGPDALHAATALLLLAPHVPLLWMGQEWNSRVPFYYFTDYASPLAEAVRDGRRREFAAFAAFRDRDARLSIPDPNDRETYLRSIPDFDSAKRGEGALAASRCRALLALRKSCITPYAPTVQTQGTRVLGPAAVLACWRLAPAHTLSIWVNLAGETVTCTPDVQGSLLYETQDGAFDTLRGDGSLVAHSLIALLENGKVDV